MGDQHVDNALVDNAIFKFNVAKEGGTAYYVDGANGNDSYNGLSWQKPFATIQHAIDTAPEWATIYVKYLASSYLSATAAAAQPDIDVNDGSEFKADQYVLIMNDDYTRELHQISSVSGNTITVTADLANEFTTAKNSVLYAVYNETPDIPIGKDNIRIIGSDQQSAVIAMDAGSGSLVAITDVSNIYISNLMLVNAQQAGNGINIDFSEGPAFCQRVWIDKCRIVGFAYGIISNAKYNTFSNNFIEYCNNGLYLTSSYDEVTLNQFISCSVGVLNTGSLGSVHDNTFRSCSKGVYAESGDTGSVYHNNYLSCTTDEYSDAGTGVQFWDSYHSSLTTDTGNTGICDSRYSVGGSAAICARAVPAKWG